MPGRWYHVALTADGPRIRVFLDRVPVPVIDAVDSTYAGGRFGLNVFDGAARFQNVAVA